MYKKSGKAMGFTLIAFMLCLLLAFPAFTQTSGKIAGVVRDAENGEPLPGANVVIVGTTMGATTDANGRYFILNVPPGEYSVKASFMGYKEIIQENIQVQTGITAEANFDLTPTTITGESVTVVAERPLVEKTLTQSKTTMGADELNNALPVGTIDEIVETSASTFRGYIRGGRKYETKYLVDGVDVSDSYFSGGTGAFGEDDVGHGYQSFRRSENNEYTVGDLPNSALQEMNVYAGTFTAEYPTASAGIVNMVTKTGGDKYSGKIFVRGTPSDRIDHFGTNPYYMKDSQGGKIGYFERKELLEASDAIKDRRAAKLMTWNEDLCIDEYMYDPVDSVGLGRSYEIETSLSGPIPGLGDKAGFFFSGNFQNMRRSALPFDVNKRISGTLKLHYDLNPDQRITLYGQLNDGGKLFNFVNWKFNPHWLWYMEGAPRYKDLGLVAYAKWTHTLSPETFYEVQVSQTNKTSWLGYPDDNGDGYSDLDETGEFIDFDSRQEYLKYVGGKTKTQSGVTFIDYTTVDGYMGDYLTDNPDAVLGPTDPNRSFFYSAIDQDYMENKVPIYDFTFARPHYPAPVYDKTTRNATTIKADLTSQITYNHQIKTGAQFRLHYVDVDKKQAELGGAGHQYPMEAFHVDQHTFHPKEFAFYLQDRIEYKGMIVNVGARIDGYNNDTEYFVNDFHPWDYIEDATQTLWELKPVRNGKVGWKWFFSPRLGVSHPISDRMAMHYSFGKFIQYPSFVSLYKDYNFTNYSASPRMTTSWVDQDPMKSTSYEIGLQWSIISDITLDGTVYYRDVENYSNMTFNLTPYQGQGLNIRTTWGHADSRGIEVTLQKRRTTWYSGRLTYAYSYIKAARRKSGNDPSQVRSFSASVDSANYAGLPFDRTEYYPYREENIVVRSTQNPLAGGYDRTHRFTGTMQFFLPYNIKLTAVGYAMSGFKYIQQENISQDPWFDISPPMKEGPWNYWLNLRLAYQLDIGGIGLRPFVEVRNVTNHENILSYRREYFTSEQAQSIFELGRDGEPNTGDEQDPQGTTNLPFDIMGRSLYGPARQIWVGMNVDF